MKTKIRIIICGFMLLLLGSACNDFLDVHPDGEILGDDLLTDEDGFEDALYGAYATMRGDTLYGRYMTYYVMMYWHNISVVRITRKLPICPLSSIQVMPR